MKKWILLFFIGFISTSANSQLYMTRNGSAGFFSKTDFEDIKAENNPVFAIVDATKMNVAVTMLMKGFVFKKQLMQEHFNENYVESDLYPKATFSGSISKEFIPSKNGVYTVTLKGVLSMHNSSKQIEVPASIEIKNEKLLGSAQFKIKPEDFNITIPAIVRDKIEKELLVSIKIDCTKSK